MTMPRKPPTPKKPQPWDVPPPPAIGDLDETTTFASVGRALSNWEFLESRLSGVFSILLGLNDSTEAAIRAYGSVLTFRGRADMLDAAAEAHFLRHPNARVQTHFDNVLQVARNCSPRRNEIAHGVVQKYRHIDPTRPKGTFVLAPSIYATNKRNILLSESTPPRPMSVAKYAYSSVEIDALGKYFRDLAEGASSLWAALAAAYLRRQKP